MDLKFSHFDYTDNLAQQRDLFKDCFPETNGEAIQEEKHYMWKFHSFPNKSVRSFEYACYMGDDMAGYYAAIPYRYKIGKKITDVGMVCDVMTSSKQRGKGVFTKMGAYSTAELSTVVPFTIGYPIRKEVIPGHLKIGWKIGFSMPLYMKFIRLDTLLRTKKIGFLSPLANIFINIYNGLVSEKINKQYNFKLSNNIEKIDGFETFSKEWINSVPNALIKDLEFSKWRYSAPEREYNFLSVYNSAGKMVAFVSYRKIVKEGVLSYAILDYMVLPEGKDSHGLINKALTDSAKKKKLKPL